MLRDPLLAVLCACLGWGFGMGLRLASGWMDGPEPLVQHDGGEYRFLYPARWTVTYDTFDVATPDSRIVALRGPGGSVLMVHSFVPASNLSAQQFADEITRQRRAALSDLGAQGGEIQKQVHEPMRIAGAYRDGLRQEFEIARGGLRFAQMAHYVRVEIGQQELFFSLHSPVSRAEWAESIFAQVLASLEVDRPRAVARRSP